MKLLLATFAGNKCGHKGWRKWKAASKHSFSQKCKRGQCSFICLR